MLIGLALSLFEVCLWLMHKSGLIKGMPGQTNLRFSPTPLIDSFGSRSAVDYWGLSMRQQDWGRGLLVQNHSWGNLHEWGEWELPFAHITTYSKCILHKALITPVSTDRLYWGVYCPSTRLSEKIHQSVILFCKHTFQQTTEYTAAWNFSLFPLILWKYFRKAFWMFCLTASLQSLHLPHMCIIITFFSRMAINQNLFERDDVYRCENEEKKQLAWSPLDCQHADSIYLSRSILTFLQSAPIPKLLVGSEKSKWCTSEEYQRGDAWISAHGLYL